MAKWKRGRLSTGFRKHKIRINLLMKETKDITTSLVNDIIATIKDEEGTVQYLKSISYNW